MILTYEIKQIRMKSVVIFLVLDKYLYTKNGKSIENCLNRQHLKLSMQVSWIHLDFLGKMLLHTCLIQEFDLDSIHLPLDSQLVQNTNIKWLQLIDVYYLLFNVKHHGRTIQTSWTRADVRNSFITIDDMFQPSSVDP